MPTTPETPLTRYRQHLASLHPLLADRDPLELVDLFTARLVVSISVALSAYPTDPQPMGRLSAARYLTDGDWRRTSGP